MLHRLNIDNKNTINKNNINEILKQLDKKLGENQLYLELTLYDGNLMNILYDNRPATRDIDCTYNINDEKLLINIVDDIRFIYNLEDNWFNNEIQEPLKVLIVEDSTALYKYKNLKVSMPSKEQLLTMKILASRPEPSKDFIDAALLCNDLNIKTKNELLNTVKAFVPLSLLGTRQIQFIKYLGEDLGYDWK